MHTPRDRAVLAASASILVGMIIVIMIPNPIVAGIGSANILISGFILWHLMRDMP